MWCVLGAKTQDIGVGLKLLSGTLQILTLFFGAALLSYGAFLVYEPAAYVVAGSLLLLFGYPFRVRKGAGS
jgi:hypothetical protein